MYITVIIIINSYLTSLFHIGKDRLANIQKHYLNNGLTPREHKRAGRRAHNCLPFVDIKLILNFLVNYSEEHAILLPGRVPGYKRSDVQLLPSSTTKRVIILMCFIDLSMQIPF